MVADLGRVGRFDASNNQLTGTIPTSITATYPVASTTWSFNCLIGVSSRYASCDFAERAALVDVFGSTGGWGSWSVSTNWLNATAHPCSWFGVTCSAGNGTVVYVLLVALDPYCRSC